MKINDVIRGKNFAYDQTRNGMYGTITDVFKASITSLDASVGVRSIVTGYEIDWADGEITSISSQFLEIVKAYDGDEPSNWADMRHIWQPKN